MSPLRQIDWKVLFFALLACYAIPWLVFGLLVSALVPAGEIVGWRLLLFNSYVVMYFLVMPLAAGYFTARYSKNRPQLHVLLVVLLGTPGLMFARSSSLGEQLAAGAVSLVMASLGAFVVLRGSKRET